MKRSVSVAVLLATLFTLARADDSTQDVPRSPAATAAVSKARTAAADAQRVYRQAVEAAIRDEIEELKAAQKTAMQNNALDEANRIRAAIRRAGDSLASLLGRTFVVHADHDWQPAMPVRVGQHLRIAARGQWSGDVRYAEYSAGPDGKTDPQGSALMFYLEGRISPGGATFKVGSSTDLVVDRDGTLELQMFSGGSNVNVHHGGALTVDVVDVLPGQIDP